jgi:hypothetical protein
MVTRNFSRAERRRVPQDANRPRTRPKHSDRDVAKVRPLSAERDAYPQGSDLLKISVVERFFRPPIGWSTTNARANGRKMRIGGAP